MREQSTSQNIGVGARAMVSALFERIAGNDSPSLVLPARLVSRDTA